MSAELDVAVVGAGPAGLAAARGLALAGADVAVFERESDAGGTPRHCEHQGFGLRDLRRPLAGPAYAARCAERATRAGASIELGTQVTGWAEDGGLSLAGADGPRTVRARAVLLATGCRERPRAARLIPGTRARGVFTTGTLQRLVADGQRPVGRRAVVVGAEHVSYSALETLRHGGAQPVLMTTELDRSQTFAAFAVGARVVLRVELRTRTVLECIHGRGRVEAVELRDLATGRTEIVECDTVVLTADWIPERELAQLAGVTLDPGTRGPRVDGSGRTDREGVFVAGNVLHGAETADIAALEGRAVAASILCHLQGAAWPHRPPPITVAPPIAWVVPNALPLHAGGRIKIRAAVPIRRARVLVEQSDRVLASAVVRRLMPGRAASMPAGWADGASDAQPVRISLAREDES